MPLMNMGDMLKHAYRHQYALGAFGVDDGLLLEGVIRAAEAARSPVILNLVDSHFEGDELEAFIPVVLDAARRASVPVAVHVDHLTDMVRAQRVISLGCDGIMIDHSSLNLSDNIRNTAECVKLAHQCGVTVEGELGHVPGELSYGTDEAVLTSASEVRTYVERTGIDCLAVSIGNIHGNVKGGQMDSARLARIHQSVDIPLVLHGGTGLSPQQYRKAIGSGVAKINYYTGLIDAISKKTKPDFRTDHRSNYREWTQGIVEVIQAEAMRCMTAWRSDGRAAEVSAQCRRIDEILYVATFTFPPVRTGQSSVETMLNEAHQSLNALPGVKQVRVGTVGRVAENRYSLIITLVNDTAARQFLDSSKQQQIIHRLSLSYASESTEDMFFPIN